MLAKRPISNRILLRICALGLCCCLMGCASPTPAAKALSQPPVPPDVEKAALEDGLLAFKEGEYKKAAAIFEALSADARLPETGRKAIFGQASALLALAQTPEEYAKAASTWDQWSNQARAGLEGEDPRLLTPFIWKAIQAGMNDSTPGVSQKIPKEMPGPNHRNALQSKEKELVSLKVKLEAREREIRRLRHQLESLEEIHRKYQEKKQEASP